MDIFQVDISTPNSQQYKPKDKLQLTVSTKSRIEDSLVALSAVDTALYNLRSNDKDPLKQVNEQSCTLNKHNDKKDAYDIHNC